MKNFPVGIFPAFVRSLTIALAPVLIAHAPAIAQVKYPTGPVELVVTFAPGGAADSAGRSLAPYLSKYLGVPVVVKNVPPPRTGEDIFSRSKPDGYTIGVMAGGGGAREGVCFLRSASGEESSRGSPRTRPPPG